MTADSYYRCLGPLRYAFFLLTSPLQYIADYPMQLMHTGGAAFRSKQVLMDENDALHRKQLFIQEKLQRLNVIHHENTQLKAILSLADVLGRRSVAARILAIDTSRA